jgi:hypothetical protein
VTAYSKIDIEILCKFPLKSDVVVGKVSLDINGLLHSNNGECKYTKFSQFQYKSFHFHIAGINSRTS